MGGRNGKAQAAMYSLLEALQGGSSQLRSGSYPFGVRDERIDAVGHPTNNAASCIRRPFTSIRVMVEVVSVHV